jgi:hypothetical protein
MPIGQHYTNLTHPPPLCSKTHAVPLNHPSYLPDSKTSKRLLQMLKLTYKQSYTSAYIYQVRLHTKDEHKQ